MISNSEFLFWSVFKFSSNNAHFFFLSKVKPRSLYCQWFGALKGHLKSVFSLKVWEKGDWKVLLSRRTVKRWAGDPEQRHRDSQEADLWACGYISGDSHRDLGTGWDFLHSRRVGVWIMGTCTLKQTEGWRTWRCLGSRFSSGYREGLFCVSTWKSDAREGYPGVPLSTGCSTLGPGGDDSWDGSLFQGTRSVYSAKRELKQGPQPAEL